MREDEKDDNIVHLFLPLFQEQDGLNRTRKMFSVEYKPGVSQGGSVICPISIPQRRNVGKNQAFMHGEDVKMAFVPYPLGIMPTDNSCVALYTDRWRIS